MKAKNVIPLKPYPELPGVLKQLIDGVKSILSDNLTGIYLVGSLATGDFDLDSDIDFLVVIKNELSNEMVFKLQEMHRAIHDRNCYPAKHLEGSYIRKELLGNPHTMIKQKIWYLDNGSRTLELSDHDNRWHVHWVLREKGIVLWGPEPATLMKPIPVHELKQDVLVILDLIAKGFAQELDQELGFYNSRFGQSFVVLTMCRILQTLSTGSIQSKKAGKDWAKNILDAEWRDFIEQAWEEREGVRFCTKIRERADQQLLERTNEFIKHIQKCYL